MTAWAPEAIAYFAGKAGWAGEDLAVAVAVALASSDGRDHLVVSIPPPPLHEYVGLWLVPANERTGRTVAELLNPYVNADTARRLWLLEGGGWSWSHAWQTGRWRWRMIQARRAVQHPRLPASTSTAWPMIDVGALRTMLDLNINQSQRG